MLAEFGRPKLSYLKLSENLAHGDERLRTYYYDCAPYVSEPPKAEEKLRQANFDRFKRALEMEPRFQVRLGRLAKYIDEGGAARYEQKKVDVLLTVDLLKLALEHQLQRAVLFAGDSDFVPAIQIARDAGVVIQLYYYDRPRPHAELMSSCDERTKIDQAFLNAAT
ncbi:MAG: NYN domain-containing protein [Planctomycetota bacterium]